MFYYEFWNYHCLALALHFGICASVEILDEDNDDVHYRVVIHNKKMYRKIIINQESFNNDFVQTGKNGLPITRLKNMATH